MASVNKVILVGNCGRDAELRYLPSGSPVANVSLATSYRRKDKQTGQYTDDTQWHRISFFDRLAEIAGQYIKKGSPIYVEGRLKYGKYTGQDGIERNTVDIVATELQLLGGRENNGGASYGDNSHGYQNNSGGGNPAPAPAPMASRPSPAAAPQPAPFEDDDIPF